MTVLFLQLLLCMRVYAFSAEDILSPAEGTWANIQPLVLNVDDGSEVYYTVSGNDPMMFGFAYDGPAVIDQTGLVHLKITVIDKQGNRSDFAIDYTVKKPDLKKYSAEEKKFINMISYNPLRKYTAGTVFSIPQTFDYAIGCSKTPRFFTGRVLSFGKESNVVRYIPFTVSAGNELFRFVMRTAQASTPQNPTQYLPFDIVDWNVIVPSDSSFVYRLDDGAWKDSLSTLYTERNETHVVLWKKVGETDDKVQSFVLYPKPTLITEYTANGAAALSLQKRNAYTDFYALGKIRSANDVDLHTINADKGLYKTLVIDSFFAEEVKGDFSAGVYLNGIYQGDLSAPYTVDRLPPVAPQIFTDDSDKDFFRTERNVYITSEDAASIFYATSVPVPFEGEKISEMQETFAKAEASDYTLLDGSKFSLTSVGGSATFYNISAYAIDSHGNVGDKADFSLIVDGKNIYLNANASVPEENSTSPKGTYQNPLTSFSEAADIINTNGGMTLHLAGLVDITESATIEAPCTIDGKKGILIFSPTANLTINNTDVSFIDCAFVKNSSAQEADSFIKAKKAKVSFVRCDVTANYEKKGRLIQLDSSTLNVTDSSLSVYAASYACAVAAVESEVSVSRSSCAVSSYTAVCYSSVNSMLSLNSTIGSINSYTGKIAELSDGTLSISDNNFSAAFENPKKAKEIESVWKSNNVTILKDEHNRITGFKDE